MKVLHVCLASFYIDNHSYQENMLPKYHKKLGFEVEILASLMSFDQNGNSCFLKEATSYINENGIPVTRLNYRNTTGSKRLRQYKNTYKAIEKVNPDIIFVHGCQFLDIKYITKYVEKFPEVKVYVDNHADFSNSATNWISKNILHKVIWRNCAKKIEPITTKFYGVLPARVDFLIDMYNIPKEKVELLVMGADDEEVKRVKDKSKNNLLRSKYGIEEEDILIITGGKIDNAKLQTLDLMKAVREMSNPNIKLIVFGSVIESLKEKVEKLSDGVNVQYIGWLKSNESYDYLAASDLVVFPGRHSVLWEQAAGLGKPIVVKYWEGTTHVDLGGNCRFLYKDSLEEVKSLITEICLNKNELKNMKNQAENLGVKQFSYLEIARRSII